MRAVTVVKKYLFVIALVCISTDMLWAARTQEQANIEVDTDTKDFAVVADSDGGELFWISILRQSSVESREESRANRQIELANMIQDLQGVSAASVVLGYDDVQSLWQSRKPMTACVTVDPTGYTLPQVTVDAIRRIVANATIGLNYERVTVINNITGTVCPALEVAFGGVDTAMMKEKVEGALGLLVATVSVSMQHPSEAIFQIPMRNDMRPHVRVSVPRSWVVKRSQQVGGSAIALNSIRQIVKGVVPNSVVDLLVVQDATISTNQNPTKESFAKQLAILVGLFTILLSGLVVNRRRRASEPTVVVGNREPMEEATRILQMDHQLARQTINALDGARKTQVLQAIVAINEQDIDVPNVQVQPCKEPELTQCG